MSEELSVSHVASSPAAMSFKPPPHRFHGLCRVVLLWLVTCAAQGIMARDKTVPAVAHKKSAGEESRNAGAKPPPDKGVISFTHRGLDIETFTYRPVSFNGAALLIVMHGVNRNAEDYRDFVVPLADELGMLVAAPRFDSKRFSSSDYQRGGIVKEGTAQPASEWTYHFILQLVEDMRRREGRPDMPYYLIGHSAGGQFLTRLAAFQPGKAGRIVAANPGSHLFPTRDMPFPYGFGGLPEKLGGDEAIKRYLATPLTLLLGTADTGSKNLDVSANAMKQGATRFERGRACFALAKRLAKEKGWPFRWRLLEVKDIAHDGAAMLSSSQAAAALLESEASTTSR